MIPASQHPGCEDPAQQGSRRAEQLRATAMMPVHIRTTGNFPGAEVVRVRLGRALPEDYIGLGEEFPDLDLQIGADFDPPVQVAASNTGSSG